MISFLLVLFPVVVVGWGMGSMQLENVSYGTEAVFNNTRYSMVYFPPATVGCDIL